MYLTSEETTRDDESTYASRADDDGETILVVEDEELVRRLIVEVLETSDYRTLEAGDGSEALAILDREAVDLVITDLVLPGMGGVEMARRLAEGDREIPVLVISGYSRSLAESGDNHAKHLPYLPKPFTPRQLLAEVRALLD